MKKQNLKVGETYAVFFWASEARSKYRYTKPKRAKLVEINGQITDTFVTRKALYSDGKHVGTEDVQEQVTARGIIVELLDEPLKTTSVPDVGRALFPNSRMHPLTPAGLIDSLSYRQVEDGEEIGTHERSYTQVALQNAGCFYSTWDEYLVEEQERKDRAARRKREDQERLQQEIDEDPVNRERLTKLIAKLTAHGYTVQSHSTSDNWRVYRNDVLAFRINVTVRDDRMIDAQVVGMDISMLASLLDVSWPSADEVMARDH